MIGLTIDDIVNLTPKFFAMHRDDIIIRDIGSHALLSIQHNLVAGTLAPFAKESTQVQQLLEDVLAFKISYVSTVNLHRSVANNLQGRVHAY